MFSGAQQIFGAGWLGVVPAEAKEFNMFSKWLVEEFVDVRKRMIPMLKGWALLCLTNKHLEAYNTTSWSQKLEDRQI
jgi:hypothetical protein